LKYFFNEISFQTQRIFGNQVTIDKFVGENRQTRIIVSDTAKVLTIVLPDLLARILGFESSSFRAGEHLAPKYQSNELFDQLDKNLTLVLTLYQLATTSILIDEPDSNDIISILEHCVEILLKYNFDVSIPVGPNNDVVYVDIGESLQLRFPNVINQMLNLQDDYVFSGLRTEIKLPPPPKNEILETQKYGSIRTNQIIVSSNIADPMLYASTCYPILRLFPREPNNADSVYHKIFDPVYYVGISKSDAQSIQVSLTDDKFNYLSTNKSSATTVVLHFRRKRTII